MINKIGVENFRVFKDYTEFELRPLTLKYYKIYEGHIIL
jgi:hypothetical protein